MYMATWRILFWNPVHALQTGFVNRAVDSSPEGRAFGTLHFFFDAALPFVQVESFSSSDDYSQLDVFSTCSYCSTNKSTLNLPVLFCRLSTRKHSTPPTMETRRLWLPISWLMLWWYVSRCSPSVTARGWCIEIFRLVIMSLLGTKWRDSAADIHRQPNEDSHTVRDFSTECI